MWIFNFHGSIIKVGSAYYKITKRFQHIRFKKVLILNKRTRYEIEKSQRPGISENNLESLLRKRGSDFDRLMRHHLIHQDSHNKLVQTFKNYCAEVISVKRTEYNEDAVAWADLVVSAGGDGNFLLAASQIKANKKPIVGFNTDPKRSEGNLCIPSQYSIEESVKKLFNKEFNWLYRNRIQVTLTGTTALEVPVNLDTCDLSGMKKQDNVDLDNVEVFTKVLPDLSLNEVFMGEIMSSQVSYFEITLPNYPKTKVKCSGLCVCTGTGSTSWNLSMNRISKEKVERLLKIAGVNCSDMTSLTKQFNKSLTFPPDNPKMFYTLRDLICARVWPDPPGILCDDFTNFIKVKSKCHAANLVIDGGRAYTFCDGTVASLKIDPKKALKTIVLKSDDYS